MLREFTLANLCKLDDGKAERAFLLLCNRAAKDCLDRPGENKSRKILLEVTIAPVMNQDGTADEVTAQLSARSKTPDYKTRQYSFGLRANGIMVFSEDSPADVNQSTFFDNTEAEAE